VRDSVLQSPMEMGMEISFSALDELLASTAAA
jgi:hypothetical protein